MNNVIHILKERGLIDAISHEKLEEIAKSPLTLYCGFDPTAESLHLGNLVAIMTLAWYQKLGHTPVVLVGGATGMIGDPSGKIHERQLLDKEQIDKNIQGIQKNLSRFLNFTDGKNKAILLNNSEWLDQFSLIEFLREVGKWFRLGPMLAKDSVKTRLESEEGISFTEFSYQLLQAYDFLYLHDHYGVVLQIGGSDQWGNITSGMDIVRKVRGKNTYAMTTPLLVSSDGKKIGKTEKGAIWLSPDKLSSYDFYQYLFRIPDSDVIRMMRMLTFMDLAEIYEYESQMKESHYVPNTVQKRLAEELTLLVHGKDGLNHALQVTEGLSPGGETVLDPNVFEVLSKKLPTFEAKKIQIIGQKLLDSLAEMKILSSKGAIRRLIQQGALSLNNQKILDESFVIERKLLIADQWLLLSLGKKNKVLIHLK